MAERLTVLLRGASLANNFLAGGLFEGAGDSGESGATGDIFERRAPTNIEAGRWLLTSSGAAAWPPARGGDAKLRTRYAVVWLALPQRIC